MIGINQLLFASTPPGVAQPHRHMRGNANSAFIGTAYGPRSMLYTCAGTGRDSRLARGKCPLNAAKDLG